MYIDGSQRETLHLFTQKLVNTHKNSRKLCGNKNVQTQIIMQYGVDHHFSSESLVQSSDTYNRQEAVYTRTSSLQGGIGACQAFSTDACCYI